MYIMGKPYFVNLFIRLLIQYIECVSLNAKNFINVAVSLKNKNGTEHINKLSLAVCSVGL